MSNDSKLLCFVLFCLFVCFVLFSGPHMSDCGYFMMQRVCFFFCSFTILHLFKQIIANEHFNRGTFMESLFDDVINIIQT